MNDANPGICRLRWCQEAEGHAPPHRRTVLDTIALDPTTGRRTIVQVGLEGHSARVVAVVLVVGASQAGLTWPQARSVSSVLHTLDRKWSES